MIHTESFGIENLEVQPGIKRVAGPRQCRFTMVWLPSAELGAGYTGFEQKDKLEVRVIQTDIASLDGPFSNVNKLSSHITLGY